MSKHYELALPCLQFYNIFSNTTERAEFIYRAEALMCDLRDFRRCRYREEDQSIIMKRKHPNACRSTYNEIALFYSIRVCSACLFYIHQLE